MKRRTICILLALVLSLSLLPIPAAAAGGVKINSTNFPDAAFRNYVHSEYDKNSDWTLSSTEIAAAKGMYIYGKGIKNLKGVEFLTSLTVLDCMENNLKKLDLSKNTKLTELYCSYNSISELNVSACTALTVLNCWGNPLGKLDVTKNTRLETLICGEDNLQALNVSKNTKLKLLDCAQNHLQKLDITKNSGLKELYCHGNEIKSLNISYNPYLVCTYLNGTITYESTFKYYCLGAYCMYFDYSNTITGYQPTITSQPKDQLVSPGNAAAFTVEVRGEYLSYQWYRMKKDETEFTAMAGETDSVLVVSTKYYDVNGSRYYCAVTSMGANNQAVAISDVAKLTFMEKPSITAHPAAKVTAIAGKTATFTVKGRGGALKYQWQVMKKGTTKWVNLSGKTGATLTLTASGSLDGNKYRCRVYNLVDEAFSNSSLLTVIVKPKVTTQPKDASVKAGSKVTFKIKASGTAPQYQWYCQKPGTSKWVKVSGATKASYAFTAKKSQDGYKYRCNVKNKAGSVNSKAAVLTVK